MSVGFKVLLPKYSHIVFEKAFERLQSYGLNLLLLDTDVSELNTAWNGYVPVTISVSANNSFGGESFDELESGFLLSFGAVQPDAHWEIRFFENSVCDLSSFNVNRADIAESLKKMTDCLSIDLSVTSERSSFACALAASLVAVGDGLLYSPEDSTFWITEGDIVLTVLNSECTDSLKDSAQDL